MLQRISDNLPAIIELCKRFDVELLDLFGSAARGDFDPTRSDIDLFVEFRDYDSPRIADQWFGLQEELEKLLGAEIQLTTPCTINNPYFFEVANRHRVSLYAA